MSLPPPSKHMLKMPCLHYTMSVCSDSQNRHNEIQKQARTKALISTALELGRIQVIINTMKIARYFLVNTSCVLKKDTIGRRKGLLR